MKVLTLCFVVFSMLGLSFPSSVYAQDVPLTTVDSIDNNILFRKEMTFAIIAHTNGLGIGFRYGSNKDFFRKRMFEFDLVEMKSNKEQKIYNNPGFGITKRYTYGKENYLYLLRAGYGLQQLLAQKPYWGGIEVRAFLYGGISLGFAKPYYLTIANFYDVGVDSYRLSIENYDPDKHFPDRRIDSLEIYGRASFFNGVNETKIYPGLYTKFGFNIEFGAFSKSIKILEVGATLEGFPKAIPIMAKNSAHNYFLTAYLSFNWGRRYNDY